MIECFQPPATRLSEKKKRSHFASRVMCHFLSSTNTKWLPGSKAGPIVSHQQRFYRLADDTSFHHVGDPSSFFLESITLVAALQVLHVHFKVGDRVTKRRICWHFRISNPSFEFCGLAQWSDNGAPRNAREYWHGVEKGRYWTCWRLSVRNDLFAKINFKVKLVMTKKKMILKDKTIW